MNPTHRSARPQASRRADDGVAFLFERMRAGIPAATDPGGTSRLTTALAAMTAASPTVTDPMTTAPA